MGKNALLLMAILFMHSCKQNTLEGYWEATYFNEGTYADSYDSPIINPYFLGTIKVLPIIEFTEKQVEFPLGFKGWESLSWKDNFRFYKLKGKTLQILGEGNEEAFDLDFLSQDSLCIMKDNVSIICFKRKQPFSSCDLRQLEFNYSNEYLQTQLKINYRGEISLTREGIKEDIIKEALDVDAFAYIQKLISRASFVNNHSQISDAPDYFLKIQCGQKIDTITSSGVEYLPYTLKSLLINLEKLTKAY